MTKEFKIGDIVRHKSETGPDMVIMDFAIDGSNPANILKKIKDLNQPICRYYDETTKDWKKVTFISAELLLIENP